MQNYEIMKLDQLYYRRYFLEAVVFLLLSCLRDDWLNTDSFSYFVFTVPKLSSSSTSNTRNCLLFYN